MPITFKCPKCGFSGQFPCPNELFYYGYPPEPPKFCQECGTQLVVERHCHGAGYATTNVYTARNAERKLPDHVYNEE